jgi:hypothetical protein
MPSHLLLKLKQPQLQLLTSIWAARAQTKTGTALFTPAKAIAQPAVTFTLGWDRIAGLLVVGAV